MGVRIPLFFSFLISKTSRVSLLCFFVVFTVVLEVMATHPECQKRGLASTVLKWACERVDREGIEFYLDASTQGRPLYEKFGFVAEMEKMDSESKSDPMRRPSKV